MDMALLTRCAYAPAACVALLHWWAGGGRGWLAWLPSPPGLAGWSEWQRVQPWLLRVPSWLVEVGTAWTG